MGYQRRVHGESVSDIQNIKVVFPTNLQ